jgi:hypothetical protein
MAEKQGPYANLLLPFEARLVGFPESLIQAVWEALDVLHLAEGKAEP